MTRWQWFQQFKLAADITISAAAAAPPRAAVFAFEGGIGGLGKTKPEMGVNFLSPPLQDEKSGLVTAELLIDVESGKQQQSSQVVPLLVSFESPAWPLLPTAAGLQVRDVRQPESAFVQIVSDPALLLGVKKGSTSLSKAAVRDVIMTNHVLSSTGKFGAYGSPTDLKVQAVARSEDNNNSNDGSSLWLATFTTLTPGLRESDRRVFVKCVPVVAAPTTATTAAPTTTATSSSSISISSSTYLVFVAGTTLQRFAKQEAALGKMVDSLRVVAAPATRLKQ